MEKIKTKTKELPESRMRVDVEVAADEVQVQLEQTAKSLGKDLKMPGFRKGKVPSDIVMKRLGREAVFQQMLRDWLEDLYRRALIASDVGPIGEPKLEFGEMPNSDEVLKFAIEVGVRPKTKLGKYKGIEAGKREADVAKESVAEEIERLKQSVARLDPVERPLKEGDYAVLDFEGKIDGEVFEGGLARDYSLEIGSNSLLEGFEEQLIGASANDERQVEVVFPDDYREDRLAGKKAVFDVKVKAAQEVTLPETEDEIARQVSEFDTIGELRSDIEEKLKKAQENSIEQEYMEAVLDSAVKESEVDLPEDIVYARSHEMWHQMEHKLQQQGITPDKYAEIVGKDREQVLEELKVSAARDLKRESLLEAVVEKENLQVTDDELLDAIGSATQGDGVAPLDLLEQLRGSGQDKAFRQDLVTRKAAKFLADESKPISIEQAQAKDKLWNPEKERPGAGAEIWTPGKK